MPIHPYLYQLQFDVVTVNMDLLLKIEFCFLLVIASVRAEVDMDTIYSQQKALEEHMENTRFSNKVEAEAFLLKVINATFSAGCSVYNTFLNSESISSLF